MGRDHLEDPGIKKRMILQLVLDDWYLKDWIKLAFDKFQALVNLEISLHVS